MKTEQLYKFVPIENAKGLLTSNIFYSCLSEDGLPFVEVGSMLNGEYDKCSVLLPFHPSPKEISEEEIEKEAHAYGQMSERGYQETSKWGFLRGAWWMKKALSLPSSGSKTEAVEFAEWIERNNFVRVLKSKGLWLWHNPFYPDGIETEPVYQLFLKDKQQ